MDQSAGNASKQRSLPSIRTKLALVVLACVMSAVLGFALLINHFYERERAQIKRDALLIVQSLVLAVDRDLNIGKMAALAMATSHHLATNDLAAFHAQAKSLVNNEFPAFNFVLSDQSAQQLVNTLRPYGTSLPGHGNTAQVHRVFETGKPQVSDVFIGPILRRPVVAIDVPVWRDGKVVYALAVGFLPEHLGKILAEARLPPDRIVAIFDNQGVVVARSHSPEKFVGQKGVPALIKRMQQSNEGDVDAITLEGVPVDSIFSRSPVSGWSVAIGIPRRAVLTEALYSLVWISGLVIALLSIGFLWAWHLGGGIGRSVKLLATLAPGAGDRTTKLAMTFKEADEVAADLLGHQRLVAQRTEELTREIAERKQAEEHFRTVVESISNGIIMVNQQGTIQLVNAQAERMFGYARTELLGQPIEMLIPQRVASHHALLRGYFSSNPQSRPMGAGRDLYAVRKDGNEIPVEIGLNPIAINEAAMVLAVIIDITERKHAEEELKHYRDHLEELVAKRTTELQQENAERRQAEEERDRLFNCSVDLLCIANFDGYFKQLNPAWEKTLGWTTAELMAKPFFEFVHPEDRPATTGAYASIKSGQALLNFENRYLCKDGTYKWLCWTAYPLAKEQLILSVARDITEHKRAEESLRQQREQLETVVTELKIAKEQADLANQAKSTFLSSMSHELRTPLNAVLGYAQILKRDKGLNERQTTGLNTIQQSGEHLLTLINDILDLAKIETGKFELYPTAFNLPLFLRTVGDIIRVKAEEKSLLFNFDMQADLPLTVQADEKRLRQVLLNLLSNAVKFTDRGQISLRVRCAPCYGDQARLRFDIQDSGVGISAEQQAMLFSPFTQVGDVQRRFGGTGLGLAISRQLVRLMGSDIEIDSQPGKGSRFFFEISVPAADESAALPVAPVITGYRGPRKQILIVDDAVANRAMLVDLLSSLGFDTTEASNGQDALDLAQAQIPDLIIMDMVMPVLDGPQAMCRMRLIPALQVLPIIAVSASATEEDQIQYLAAGANVFLSKPIESARLLQHIGERLKLTWDYEKSDEEETVSEMPMVVPPHAELVALHALALIGNMQDIRDWVNRLERLSQQYGPFAGKLRDLTRRYQSKAILKLVEEHLNQIVQ